MRIEADSVLHHPRPRVFAAYRDDIRAFIGYLPNVREIEVLERRDEGSVVRLHNVWRGGIELPEKLSDALETSFFSWDDRAVWDEQVWTCEWVIEPHAWKGAVTCEGKSEFVALGDDRTRLQMTGDLSIDLDRVRAVPSFLAGSLGRTAEAFLVRQITANLAATSEALAAYLRSGTTA